MKNSHRLDVSIETTDNLITDAIKFIRINKKRPDTLAIIDHIVQTEQGLDQSSLEKRIAYLGENGVLDNVLSHCKNSFYVKGGLPETLFSYLASHHETPPHTNEAIALSTISQSDCLIDKYQELDAAIKSFVLEQIYIIKKTVADIDMPSKNFHYVKYLKEEIKYLREENKIKLDIIKTLSEKQHVILNQKASLK